MKKICLFLALLPFAAALAADPPARRPSIYEPPPIQEEKRFQSCENIGGSGFYWFDTGSADVWLFDTAAGTWKFLGSPRGSNDNLKGTYELLSNKAGGVYLLNTRTGEGWLWTAATEWKAVGAPSRRVKTPEEKE